MVTFQKDICIKAKYGSDLLYQNEVVRKKNAISILGKANDTLDLQVWKQLYDLQYNKNRREKNEMKRRGLKVKISELMANRYGLLIVT